MNPDDDFEFELDDDDEEEEEEKRPPKPKKKKGNKGSSGSKDTKVIKKVPPPKKTSPKKTTKTEKTAKRNPIPEGVKKRLALNLKEISKLKKEIEEYKDEKEVVEHELETLEDEIDNLRSEKGKIEEDINKHIAHANAYEKKLSRNQKDFDNFKKRTQNEIDRNVKMGSKKIFMGIIEVIDNFDRAISETKKYGTSSDLKHILHGVDSIRKGLIKVLSDNGVEMVDPLDEPFDPNYHEAIETRQDTTIPDNTVILVDSKGYTIGDLVLRPAKVFVSKGGKPRPKPPKKMSSEEDDEEKHDDRKKKEDTDDDMAEIEDVEDLDDLIEEMDELDMD